LTKFAKSTALYVTSETTSASVHYNDAMDRATLVTILGKYLYFYSRQHVLYSVLNRLFKAHRAWCNVSWKYNSFNNKDSTPAYICSWSEFHLFALHPKGRI